MTALLASTALVFSGPAWAVDVGNYSDLVSAVAQVNAGTASTINFTGNVTLAGELNAITNGVTITGNGYTLSGANSYRGLYIAAGSGHAVGISNLTIANGFAKGGDGGFSAGGGMGAGGGIFAMSGDVTLTNVTFTGNAAKGGNGGGGGGAGGGGGMGGNGGTSGFGTGGGGLGLQASGGGGSAGGAGILPGGSGGSQGNAGGANSGGGGANNNNGGAGGGLGGSNGLSADGGAGGFGGGGGGGTSGGMGGFGGGGGSAQGSTGSSGAGGYGGGGGGGAYSGGSAGSIFGGGNGAGNVVAGFGGGGMGAGGGIFVCSSTVSASCSATLTISNSANTSMDGTVTAGAGAGGGSGNGAALGGAVFLTAGAKANYSVASGTTTTITGSIAGDGGDLGVAVSGGGTLALGSTSNSFNGLSVTGSGTRVGAGGTGALSYGAVSLDDGTGLVFTANGSFSNALTITGDPIFDTAGNTVTWSGLITGAGDVDVIGGGTLILTNTANDYTLGTVVEEASTLALGANAIGSGTLTLGNASTLTGGKLDGTATFSLTNAVAITAGTSDEIDADSGKTLTLSGILSGSGGLTIGGPGIVSLSNASNSYSGALTIASGGTLGFSGAGSIANVTSLQDNGTIDIASLSASSVSLASLTGSGIVKLGAKTLTLTADATFSGVIQGTGSVELNAPGHTATFSGANTYSGGTKVTSGTLVDAAASVFNTPGDATSGIVSSGIGTGTLTLYNGVFQMGVDDTLANAITGVVGAFDANGHIVTLAGHIGGGDLYLADSAHSATGAVTITGGSNSYSQLFVSAGYVYVGSSGAISNTADVRINGTGAYVPGVLDINGYAVTIDALNGDTLGTVTDRGAAGGSAGTLTFAPTSGGTFAGTISDDHAVDGRTLALVMNGRVDSATQVLSHANTYAGGTTLTRGTLEIGDAGALGSGAVIFNGGTLKTDGAYTIGNAIQVAGGTFDNGGYDTILSGNITGSGGSTLGFAGAGSTSLTGDNSGFAGNLSVTGSTLILNGARTAGTGTIAVSGGTVRFATPDTYTSNFSLSGANTFGFDGATTLSGVISDTNPASPASLSLGLAGAATSANIELVGANTYSGGTTLTNGVLAMVGVDIVGTAGAITSGAFGTGTLTVNGGNFGVAGDYTIANDIVLSSGASVEVDGHALTLSGHISGAGGLSLNGSGGSVAITDASNSFASGGIMGGVTVILAGSSGTGTGPLGTGPITLNDATLRADAPGHLDNLLYLDRFGGTLRATNGTYAFGPISPASVLGGALTIGAPGDTGTVELSDGSSYIGGTTIAGGTALANGTTPFGDVTKAVVMNAGTTLAYADQAAISNPLQWTGNVSLDVVSGSAIQSGDVSDDSPTTAYTVTKMGAGTLKLTGGNHSSADLKLAAGTLEMGSQNALGGSNVIFDGGAFKVDGSWTIGNNFTVLSGGTFDTGIYDTELTGSLSSGSTDGALTIIGTGSVKVSSLDNLSGGAILGAHAVLEVAGASGTSAGDVAMGTGSTIRFTTTNGIFTNHFLLDGDPIFNVDSGITTTLSGVIADAASPALPGVLEKTGAGTLVLTGANTYSGGTILTGGILSADNAGALGSGTLTFDGGTLASAIDPVLNNAIAINSTGGTIQLDDNNIELTGAIADGTGGGGVLALTSAGTPGIAILSHANSYSQGTDVGSGVTALARVAAAFGTGTVTLDGGAITPVSGSTLDISNDIAVSANGGTIKGNGTSFTVSGTIGDADPANPGILTFGAGGNLDSSTVTVSGSNTYTGGTLIAGGTVKVSGSTALGIGMAEMRGDTTLSLSAGPSLANKLLLDDTTPTIYVDNGVATLSGDIVENSGTPGGFIKTGGGTLVLSTTHGNNYSRTSVQAGTLELSQTQAAVSVGTYDIGASGHLVIDGGMTPVYIGALSGAGSVLVGSGTQLNVGGAGLNGDDTTFSGGMTADYLAYDGTGTLTLSGTNSIKQLVVCGCTSSGGITLSGGSLTAAIGVGVSGQNFTVAGGAHLTAPDFEQGGGTVTISGAGTQVDATSSGAGRIAVYTTVARTPVFTISDGAQVTGDILMSGLSGGTVAPQITVTGANSLLSLTNGVQLNDGASLTVADGATLTTSSIDLDTNASLAIGAGAAAGTVGDASTRIQGLSSGTSVIANFTGTDILSAQVIGGLALTKQGSGTLVLTGANSYSGATTISGGILQVNNGGTLGAGAVVNNATLAFNTSTPITLASIISGSGKLVQQGSGALTLTATDGYTGETSIAANSTLNLVGSGRIQSSSVVTDNGVLDISGVAGGTAIQTLAGNGSVLLGSKTLQFLNGSTTFSGSITDGGAGGSVDFEGGDQVLTGTNSWTGTTTIGAGATVTVASSASLGGGSIKFFNGSVLKFIGGGTFTQSANFAQTQAPIYDVGVSTVTWSGQITGVGDLAVTGNGGTLILTNATNSYGGGTEVYGGAALKVDADGELGATASTLQLGDATTTGTLRFGGAFTLNAARSVVLGAGGGVIDTNGNAITIAQAISGGALVETGSGGTLTLANAANSYSGGTDVHGGATLAVSADGALGATATTLKLGDATTTGTLRFGGSFNLNAARSIVLGAVGGVIDTNGNATTIAQAIGGGALVVTGSGGTLTLTGANTYTGGTDVHGGATLVANTDSALGTTAGSVKLGDATTAGTLRFGGAFTLDAARGVALGAGGGVIDTNGNTVTVASAVTGGGLTKIGAGNLTLTGTSTFTGPALVNAGILSVNGTMASGVTVNAGGTLGGTGTVGATTVASGGTIAPGNSIGTLHVNGNLTLASGSVTAIELSPSAADQIAVSGTAALGGTLAFAQGAGSYGAGSDFKLITASSVNGVFSNVTGLSITGLNANVTYSATAVDLLLTTPAASGGSGSSGGGSSGSGNSGGGSSGGGSSGGGGTVTNSFLFDTYGKTANQIAAGKALAAGSNTGVLYVATGNLVATNVAVVPGALGQMAGDIHASIRGAAIEDSRIIRNAVLGRLDQAGEQSAVWGSVFGGYGSIAGDGNATALHHDSAGLIAGVDMPVSDGIRAGIAAAYSTDRSATSGHLSTAGGSNGHIIGYAGWTGGAFDLKLGGDYGWGTVHTARQVTALAQSLAGRQDQTMGQVFADAGYRIASEQWMFEPYAGIAHVEVTSGSFAEQGGTAALSGGSATDGLTYGTMGVRAALAGLSLEDIGIAPKIDLGWRHAFDTLKPGQLVSFQNTGTSFTVLGVPLGTDAAALQLGFDVTLTPDARLSLGYDGTFGSRAQNNAVRGAFHWTF